ncbi:MAG: glycosyltransferase family 9 protein [Herpetosiphonaceae bacterium]|nr:glycosyltransferase family 9 protein [Herpetosiphonaceae bacterium]
MMPPVHKIAVFRALFLGDLLCSIPAFRALRHRFPGAEISLIGLPWAADFVEHCPYLDRFVSFPGYRGIAEVAYDPARTTAFFDAAQVEGYDLALQMHGDGNVSNSFVTALGARQTLGYRQGDLEPRLTLSLPYVLPEHEVRRWLRLVQLLGTSARDERLEWLITPTEAAAAHALLPSAPAGPLVGLHVGSKELARRWPFASFARLGDEIRRRYAARIVLTGSAAERPVAAAIAHLMECPATNLCGLTDLATFAATIAQLDLLVTNDTGASHLAAATATRSVVLFGPSRPAQWAPLDRERHVVIDAMQELALPDGAAALQRLPVKRVMEACNELLRSQPQELSCVA